MRTKRLHKASKETNKLVDYLVSREWYDSPELVAILERADTEVAKVVEKAISDVLVKLQGSYTEEAQNWANGTQTTMNGDLIATTETEQMLARAELHRITVTATKLDEILYQRIKR